MDIVFSALPECTSGGAAWEVFALSIGGWVGFLGLMYGYAVVRDWLRSRRSA